MGWRDLKPLSLVSDQAWSRGASLVTDYPAWSLTNLGSTAPAWVYRNPQGRSRPQPRSLSGFCRHRHCGDCSAAWADDPLTQRAAFHASGCGRNRSVPATPVGEITALIGQRARSVCTHSDLMPVALIASPGAGAGSTPAGSLSPRAATRVPQTRAQHQRVYARLRRAMGEGWGEGRFYRVGS